MVTIIIPAYNEEMAIGETIQSLRNILDKENIKNIEILVVDDGSEDRTGEIAKENGAIVVSHPHNVGYGRSLKDGIEAAQNDTLVIIDADLTYPADAIPQLLKEYEKGFDMVVGTRTGHHYKGQMFKGPLRSILKFLVEFSAEREVPDANSGLRVFGKNTVKQYAHHLCDTFSFTTSMTLAYMMTGRFVKYIPIEYHARVGSTKVKLFWDSIRTIQYIIQAIIYYNPFKIFVLLSVLCIILSVLSFLLTAIIHIKALYILGIGSLFASLFIFCLGLLADLLRQIMVK